MPQQLKDVANQLALLRGALDAIVTGGNEGYALRKLSDADGDYAWLQDASNEIVTGSGNPNGVYRGYKGQLFTDESTPALYQNSNGSTAWTALGGGGSGFPVGPLDDATYTYEITAVSGDMDLTVTDDADGAHAAALELQLSGSDALAQLSAVSSSSAHSASVAVDSTASLSVVTVLADTTSLAIANTGLTYSHDDGTFTYTITDVGGALLLKFAEDGYASEVAYLEFLGGSGGGGSPSGPITGLLYARDAILVQADDDGGVATIIGGPSTVNGQFIGQGSGFNGDAIVEAQSIGGTSNAALVQAHASTAGGGHARVDISLEQGGTTAPLVRFGDDGVAGSSMLMGEQSDPTAPSSTEGRIYMRDNGSGKTQLCVLFNTGAVQVLATQP